MNLGPLYALRPEKGSTSLTILSLSKDLIGLAWFLRRFLRDLAPGSNGARQSALLLGWVLLSALSLGAETDELMKRAREEAAAGRRRESAVLLYKVLEKDPAQKTAWARLAVLYEKEGQRPQAQWLWGRLALDPAWGGEALYSMAALSEEMGKTEEAISFFVSVAHYHPNDQRWLSPALVRAADLAAASGDRPRARRLITYLLKSGKTPLGKAPLEKRLREWR